MQTIKKIIVLTCATWGMQTSFAHADQATNAILWSEVTLDLIYKCH